LNYTSNIIFWDASTGAPKSGVEARSKAIGVVSGFYHRIMTDSAFNASLDMLAASPDACDDVTSALVRHYQRERNRVAKIPAAEYEAFQTHITKSAAAWEEAKETSNFDLFEPYLASSIETLKQFAEYRGYTGHPYNLYIDDFEPGMTVAQLDAFFETLKSRLVPLLQKIIGLPKPEVSFLSQSYPVQQQKNVCESLLDLIGFRRDQGLFKESMHPFTMGVDIEDVRLTTHFYENDLLSAMLSTVHEGGHGIYEQNVSERLRGTPLSTGASNALHESQSRFYENNLFRNQAFVRYFYPKLKSVYPEQLAAVDAEALYRAINIVEPSLIRTEADELTYSLHILLRYELELALISGTLSVADLPKAWYDKMEQYLGVVPANDSEGVLQDVHWSEALFGYFPTYALGSAYAAQLYAYMSRDLALEDLLAAGNFEPITRWLNEKVHQFGALYEPTALIEKITGEPLNANYYCDYLEKKYTALYQL
jgi:carboxypeptidase Taq